MPWQFVPATRFTEHAAAWDALAQRAGNTPFLSSAFMAPLLHTFGSGREMLALHSQDGTLDAATLLTPAGRGPFGMWQTFQPSQLPLGPWLSVPGDALAGQAQSLVQALPGLALGLGLTQLDPLQAARPADGAQLRTLDYIDTSWVEIAGTWDAFWEGRGKNLRQNTRKAHNKLAAEGTAVLLDTVTAPEGVPAAIAEYGALETAGWKAEGGTAIHPDNAQGRFYTQMLQNFCAQGRGRIVRYCFGNQVVAMDLCIDNGPVVVILKTAYDEAFKALSPSTLMRHDEFKAWWAEGRYQRIEFFGKTLEWHTRWTAQERRLFHATTYRWPVVRSLHARLQALRQAKAAVPAVAPAPAPAPAAV